jgi:hypothetical protein
MTKRINANSKVQMEIIKGKVEAAAGKDEVGAAAEPTT